MRKRQSYRKPYRIRKKKSILKSRYFWFTILALILAGGIFYTIYFLPFIQVREINVSGTQKVSGEEIKNLTNTEISQKIFLFESKSILFIDSAKIKNNILQQFPQIGKATVKRGLPDKLNIEVKERESVGIFCQDNINCWYLDENGVVFENTGRFEVIDPVLIDGAEVFSINENIVQSGLEIKDTINKSEIKLGSNVIDKVLFEKIQNLAKKLSSDLAINITEFIIPSQGRLDAKTSEGWEMYFDSTSDLNWQVIELGQLLQKEIPSDKRGNLEYVDLRFSKVYYKYLTP